VSQFIHEATVVRHAPTKSNADARFMGSLDAPSTADGLADARALGAKLAIGKDVRLFSSPLQRSIQTMDMLCPKRDVLIDPRLREWDLGEWEGSFRSDVRAQDPGAFVTTGTLDPLVTPPGGESPEQFAQRVAAFLAHISESCAGGKSLIVTHNGVIAVMRALVETVSLRDAFEEEEPFLAPRKLAIRTDTLRLGLERVLGEIRSSREP